VSSWQDEVLETPTVAGTTTKAVVSRTVNIIQKKKVCDISRWIVEVKGGERKDFNGRERRGGLTPCAVSSNESDW